MSTFADSAARSAVRQRVASLTPEAKRQWGKMTPHQMICHLADGFRLASGERPPERVDNFLSRSVVRFVALHTPLTWPHGVKTVPEADQQAGGTKPVGWDKDHAELLSMLDAFVAQDGLRHPIFGKLTAAEWNIWAFRHMDHHLRQFGK
jgi:hypothetical protein